MNLDDLKAIRQSKGYSIDMMAELMNQPADKYLELEYAVREATDLEKAQLNKIFQSIDFC